MKELTLIQVLATSIALGLGGTSAAWAQDDVDDVDEELAVPQGSDEDLPEPRSDDDPRPPVATPAPPAGGIVKQAGIGGSVAYGRAGVLELGGSAGLAATSNVTVASINPSVGWFLADNFQLSAILGFSHVSTDQDDSTIFSFLIEPSYHLPFTNSVFGFLGFGIGGSHVDEAGMGFALAPRVGANILVGRSGILSPSVSYQYTTHDTIEMEEGSDALAVSTALGVNIGYTVMW